MSADSDRGVESDHGSAVADQEPQSPRLAEGLESSSHWLSRAVPVETMPPPPPPPAEGKVYPLNSKRLTVKHLKLLAEALELPSSCSGDELRQLVDGTLRDRGRQPENVQVFVQQRRRVTVELEVTLMDERGEFGHSQSTSEETESLPNCTCAEELREVRMQRDRLERTAAIQEERLVQLGERLDEEEERNRRAWKENCSRVQAMDAELTEKEAELADMEAQVARLSQELQAQQDASLADIRAEFAARDASTQQYPKYPPHSTSIHNELSHSPSHSLYSHSENVSESVVPPLDLCSLVHVQPRDSTQPRAPPKSDRLQAQSRQQLSAHQDEARRRRRGRAPPVEQYTGESKEEQLDDWLPTLERAGLWNEWTPEELLLQLAGHLRGRALQEWNLMSRTERSSWDKAVQGLKSRLEPGARVFAAQDFRHISQAQGETVSDFLCRLERTFQLAYGRDPMSTETRSTLLYCQLQEGLSYSLMKSPAVSGARDYIELSLAAKNEEKRQAELLRRQQYHQATMPRVGNRKLGTYTHTPQQVKSEPSDQSTDRGGQSPSVKEPRRCYNCDGVGHLARNCKVKRTESGGQQTRNKTVHFKDEVEQKQNEHIHVDPSPLTCLLSSSDSEEGSVKIVHLQDGGSASRCVKVCVQGVPIYGLIDSGADISIIGGSMFKKVAATARLRKKHFKPVDKVACSYDHRPFHLDGQMDLEISFNDQSMVTPVYIKMDAPEQLLLSEGVCRQLGILSYHPDVQVWRGGRKKVKTPPHSKAQVPSVRVRLLQTIQVPPSRSVVVPVRADSEVSCKEVLLEPIPSMESKMDATLSLVDLSKGTAYVCISNTDTSTLKLNKGVQISTATQIEIVEACSTDCDQLVEACSTDCDQLCDKSALFRVSSSVERRTERCKKLVRFPQDGTGKQGKLSRPQA